MNIKTYIVSYAYTTKSGEVHCMYDSNHVNPSFAQQRKDELEEILQQKRDVVKYDIDMVAANMPFDTYKMGV